MIDNEKVCVLTVKHAANDDRIYYKQILSLKNRYKILLIAPPDGAGQVVQDDALEYLPLSSGGGLCRRMRILWDAYRLLRHAKPRICHFHDYEILLLVPLLRVTTSIKLIYDAHEMYREAVLDRGGKKSLMRLLVAWGVHWYERMAARMCHHIVAADDGVREGLSGLPVPITVVANFPRVEMFCIRPDLRQKLEQRYAGRFVCIYQGGMSTVRGLFHMVRAVDMARHLCPALKLLLVGNLSTVLRTRVEALIEDRGLQQHIEIIGQVPHLDVPSYMSVAKVGLVPFLSTRKLRMQPSIKLFEYMACGLPIIGSDLPATTQFVNSAGCGVLYTAGDDDALAKAIVGLAGDDLRRADMGTKGSLAVRTQWSWNQMEGRLFDIYVQL